LAHLDAAGQHFEERVHVLDCGPSVIDKTKEQIQFKGDKKGSQEKKTYWR
jgi:hypothetical protein